MGTSNNQTRVQTGQQSSSLPVAAAPAEVEAFQRSPTLMAGEVAGSQGQVRIWSPNRKRLWLSCTGFGLLSIGILAAMFFTRSGGWMGYLFASQLAAFYVSVRALRRPCYLTTDDAGIGITTDRSSQALRWDEIMTATREVTSGLWRAPRIQLTAPLPVEINLTGYPCSVQGELFSLITRRAALEPHPTRPGLFANPTRMGARMAALMEPINTDIREMIAWGEKIPAIKRYRERYGTGLRESKDAIDALELDLWQRRPDEILRLRVPDSELRRELRGLILKGEKEHAIERLRKQPGLRPHLAPRTIDLLSWAPALPAESGPVPPTESALPDPT